MGVSPSDPGFNGLVTQSAAQRTSAGQISRLSLSASSAIFFASFAQRYTSTIACCTSIGGKGILISQKRFQSKLALTLESLRNQPSRSISGRKNKRCKYSGKSLSLETSNVSYAGETKNASSSPVESAILIHPSRPVCIPLKTKRPPLTTLYFLKSTDSILAAVGMKSFVMFTPRTASTP